MKSLSYYKHGIFELRRYNVRPFDDTYGYYNLSQSNGIS
jgi:hypothetical protein